MVLDLLTRRWYPIASTTLPPGFSQRVVFWFGTPSVGYFASGTLHTVGDELIGNVGHLHGDAIKDWGANHFMLLEGPVS